MDQRLRHYCRNPRCRSKLPAPVESKHEAFCTPGCYESFYQNRCRVCERSLRKQGQRGEANRLYCRPPNRCGAEARKWAEKYDFRARPLLPPPPCTNNARSAHSAATKFGLAGYRPTAHCLRDWWWGDPGIDDLSLYDKDGLTIARIVLEGDGRYHLRTPVTIPRQAWANFDEAKRGAETFGLMAKLAARIKRDNETPHPMGPALNRAWPVNTDNAVLLGAGHRIATASIATAGDPGPMPQFLIDAVEQRHAACKLAVADNAPSIAPDQKRQDAQVPESEQDAL